MGGAIVPPSIGGDQEEFSSAFDATNDSNLAFIGGGANNLVARSTGVARKM